MQYNVMNNQTCNSCRNSYQGADLELRCRINGLKASAANCEDCKRYEYEPGTDVIEISLCSGCVGRGD